MSENVTITLSHDEVLVLFDFFSRFYEGKEERLTMRNNAEYLALARISAQVEKALVEWCDPKYSDLLEAARDRVASGYPGTARGVEDNAI